MRVIVSTSGLIVALSLIIMIHSTIVNRHVRDVEVTTGLVSACDYAIDQMQDMYAKLDFSSMSEEEVKKTVIASFCEALESVIGTDGTIHVKVVQADIQTGSYDFVVEEIYSYGFKGRNGRAICERAVCFSL
ncbi:MAG: hypothetical protein PHW47_10275 [Lachnospira sp.]|nr:hypothetical protein [Lachnospira sp.]